MGQQQYEADIKKKDEVAATTETETTPEVVAEETPVSETPVQPEPTENGEENKESNANTTE